MRAGEADAGRATAALRQARNYPLTRMDVSLRIKAHDGSSIVSQYIPKKGDDMQPFTCRLFIVLCALIMLFGNLSDTGAKIEWSILKNIPLDDTPRDVAISREGTTAYILCSKSVQVYSIPENKVTSVIPLTAEFSQLALSPDGEQLFLTQEAGKQLSIIQISQVYDIPNGTSPVIGKATAPVTLVAFLDYQ
jgi:hypothetical protein